MKDTPSSWGMFGAGLAGGAAWLFGKDLRILAALPDQIASVAFHSYFVGLGVCLTPPCLVGFFVCYWLARKHQLYAALCAKREATDLENRVLAAEGKGKPAEGRPGSIGDAIAGTAKAEEHFGIWAAVKTFGPWLALLVAACTAIHFYNLYLNK